MKLTFTPFYLIAILLLAIIRLASVDFGINDSIFDVNISKAIDGVGLDKFLEAALPFDDSYIGRFFEASLAPAPCYVFFAIRPVAPIWEKTLSEYVPFLMNFFCPLMVLVIFLYFYRSSRNSAGLDHLIGFCGK